jgi:O-antigen ligase
VLIGGGIIGGLAGPVPGGALVSVSQDALLLGWAAAIATVCVRPAALRTLLRVWVWSSLCWGGFMVVAVATRQYSLAGVAAGNGTRAALTFGDPNLAGDYFFLSLMIVWASAWPKRPAARLAACAVLLAAVLVTGSNGAIFAVGLGGGLTMLLLSIRRFGLMPVISVVMMTGAITAFGSRFVDVGSLLQQAQHSSNVLLKYSLGREPESVGDRKLLFNESVPLFEQHPLLGTGPTSTVTRLAAGQAPFVKEAHDDYMAALVERGLLGAVGLLLLIGALITRCVRLVTRPLHPGFAELVPRPAALAGAVLGLLVSATFYETLHFRHLWALYGIIGALSIWGQE